MSESTKDLLVRILEDIGKVMLNYDGRLRGRDEVSTAEFCLRRALGYVLVDDLVGKRHD